MKRFLLTLVPLALALAILGGPQQIAPPTGNEKSGQKGSLADLRQNGREVGVRTLGPMDSISPESGNVRAERLEDLPLFGMEYFTVARQAVEARKLWLRRAIATGLQPPPLKRGDSDLEKERELGEDGQPLPDTNGEGQPTTTGDEGLRQPLVYPEIPGAIGGSLSATLPNLDRYQLGPGDQMTVRYWTPTVPAREVEVTVDTSGLVTIPGISRPLSARGRTLGEFEKVVMAELSRRYREVQVVASLRQLRTISVTALGEIYAPGAYQVPSVTTLFDFLTFVGGPSDQGSLRTIQLRRSDGSTHRFDLYHFTLFGEGQLNVPLQPGDVLFAPPRGPVVTVFGEVGKPARYELVPGERLLDVLTFAGGVKPSGVAQRVALASVDPGVGRRVIDVDLTSGAPSSNPPLYDGDSVEVLSIRETFQNAVYVEGPVDIPGRYQLEPGMKLSQLVGKARGLLNDAYLAQAHVFRLNADQTYTLIPVDLGALLQGDTSQDLVLQPEDRLRVYTFQEAQFLGPRRVRVNGAVQRPGEYVRASGMTVRDLLLQAGGLLPTAVQDRLYLQRRNPDGSYGPLVKVNGLLAAAGDPTQNLMLNDLDVLTVYTPQDLEFVPDQEVRILGYVLNPGTYTRSEGLRLADALERAGGPLPNASDFVEIASAYQSGGTAPRMYSLQRVLARDPDANPELKDGDLVTLTGDGQFVMRPRTITLTGAVVRPGPYVISDKGERLSSLIKRAGGLTSSSFPAGAQFFRKPELLTTNAQQLVTPRLIEIWSVVSREEYKRAAAKAYLEKLSFGSPNPDKGAMAPAFSLPGLGGTQVRVGDGLPLPKEAIPYIDNNTTVTQARTPTENELVPAGNLNVNLPSALARPGSTHDLVLMDGDIVNVPEKPTTVNVTGAVVLPSALVFEPNKDVAFYLNRAGGFTRDADVKEFMIIRASGEVIKAKMRTKVKLGDVLFVPTKVMAEKLRRDAPVIEQASQVLTSAGIMWAIIRAITR